jgi:hypothetical protein
MRIRVDLASGSLATKKKSKMTQKQLRVLEHTTLQYIKKQKRLLHCGEVVSLKKLQKLCKQSNTQVKLDFKRFMRAS